MRAVRQSARKEVERRTGRSGRPELTAASGGSYPKILRLHLGRQRCLQAATKSILEREKFCL